MVAKTTLIPAPRRSPWRSGLAPLLLLLLGLGACSGRPEYRNMTVGKQPFGRLWDAVETVASPDGYYQDTAKSDRGLGRWYSRWRVRTGALARPVRTRLEVEIEADPELEGGWILIYACPLEKVEDLSRSFGYEEDDWDPSGQDSRYEQVFRNRMQLQLGIDVSADPNQQEEEDPFLRRPRGDR